MRRRPRSADSARLIAGAPSELRAGAAFTLIGDEQQRRPSGRPLVVMPSSVAYLEAPPQTSVVR